MTVMTAARPARLYFGWRVVAALSLCTASPMGIGLSGFILLAERMAAEFGWSDSSTGNLVSAMWLAGPLVLVAAPLVKKLGPWPLVYAGMACQVLSVGAIQLSAEYDFIFVMRLLGGFGLMLIVAASPVIVAHWFKVRFATAMAIVWSAGSAGQMLLPPLTEASNAAFGWKATALALAGLLALATMLTALLVRGAKSPAQLGLLLDGLAPDSSLQQAAVDTESLGWREAIRSMNWLTAAFMCVAAFGLGATTLALQAHSPALLSWFGLSGTLAATLLSVFYASALCGALLAGWVLDRIGARFVSLVVAALVYISLLSMYVLGANSGYAIAGLALGVVGIGLGAGEVLWITLFKRQFGVPAFATTYSIFFFCFQIGMASGGFLGGASIEAAGIQGLLVALAVLYFSPAMFSLWRPGGRNTDDASALVHR